MPVKQFKSAAAIERFPKPAGARDFYRYTKQAGLYLDYRASGVKAWLVQISYKGKMRSRVIGHWLPDEGGTSLAEAAAIAESCRLLARSGQDPWTDLDEATDREADTFRKVRERFMKAYVAHEVKPNTALAYTHYLQGHEVKTWEDKPINTITRTDVLRVLDGMLEKGSRTKANRALAHYRRFFNWCAEKGILREHESVPTDRIKAPSKEKPRERVLSEQEVRLLWQACSNIGYPWGHHAKLALLTGQRPVEVASIKRQDIAGDRWNQDENKSSRATIVPLSQQAQAVIADCPLTSQLYLFSTQNDKRVSGFSKGKPRLDKEIARLCEKQGAAGAFESPWQLRDLRRTAITLLREMKIPAETCASILNHAPAGVLGRHYDRHNLLEEKRVALAKLGRRIAKITK